MCQFPFALTASLLLFACGGSAVLPGSDAGSQDSGMPDAGLPAGLPIPAMPIVSFNAKAFSSSNHDSSTPASNANGMNPAAAWVSAALPAWVAYDLSAVPVGQRQKSLAAWYGLHVPDYIPANGLQSGEEAPVDYTLEVNAAAGGGSPPSSGWTGKISVTGNARSGAQHLLDLGGANWLRMSFTRSSDAGSVGVNLDLYSAPQGATDSWLFLGDSITHLTMRRAISDLPSLAQALKPDHWPAVIEAAIGGTRTIDAVPVFDDTVKDFPGNFIVLAYGTNDDPANFQMEVLVQKVIALGKTPVVPHMPWSNRADIQAKGSTINAAIDGLYTKYPQILRGPDLWAFFQANPSYIPPGDIHPNDQGKEALRHQWAALMASVYQ